MSGVICSKRCFNAVNKSNRPAPVTPTAVASVTKKRTYWHNDGPTQNVSSLSVLMDWLTTGINYSRYRGGDGQTGETKAVLAQEVVSTIIQQGITTPRCAKDVQNKIMQLESQFKTDTDWLGATGQRVTNEPSLRAAVLERCPYYYELEAIMHDRPSVRPQLLSTDNDWRTEDFEDDPNTDEESKVEAVVSTSQVSSVQNPLSTTVPSSIAAVAPNNRKRMPEPIPQNAFIKLKEAQPAQARELQLMELGVRERQLALQEKEFAARQQHSEMEERVSQSRVEEAKANAAKLQLEAQHWKLQSTVTLLRERKRLLLDGVDADEINRALPLPPML